MSTTELYQQVAEAYHNQNKFQERDRFLVLALDAAHTAGQGNLAEQIRLKLLELNPHHLIKPYANSETALKAANFTTYLGQLKKNFPPSKAQSLLQELGVASVTRPKRTMVADHSFPVADPVDDRKTPAWSQVNIAPKPKSMESPVLPRQPDILPPLDSMPMNTPSDPLANVALLPHPVPPPKPFQLEQQPKPSTAPSRQPVIVPAPRRPSTAPLESPTNIWVSNLLFGMLLLVSLLLVAYVFVLPFYPGLAKMLKPGS